MKKPPIFIICGKSPFDSFGGGYSKFAINLRTVLEKIGHSVFIVHLDHKANITALPFFPIYSFIFAHEVEKIAKKNNYDKIIVWGIGPWGFAGALLKRTFKDKLILIDNYFTSVKHEWDGMIKGLPIGDYGLLLKFQYLFLQWTLIPFLSYFESYLLKKADRIIVNYRSTQRILEKQFHIPSHKFFYSSFSIKIEKPSKKTQEIKLPNEYILTIARQDPRKGINILLHAQKILIGQGYKIPLLIAGAGRLLNANKNFARRLEISPWVQFLGYVKNTSFLFSRATIFCLPSIEEGAGSLAVNEAMSYGLPVIASKIDGIIEDIVDGKTGMLTQVGKPNKLAKRIAYLLKNPHRAMLLGKNARKESEKRLRFRNWYNDTKRILKSALYP